MNQEAIEKSYYEQLMPGHYLDVRISEAEWKLAKIKDKDNRYISISYDGIEHRS